MGQINRFEVTVIGKLFIGFAYGKHGAWFVTTESKVKCIRLWVPAIGYGKEQSRDYIKN